MIWILGEWSNLLVRIVELQNCRIVGRESGVYPSFDGELVNFMAIRLWELANWRKLAHFPFIFFSNTES